MAKRKRAQRAGTATQVAVSVGTTLGRMAAKVDGWMAQRDEIAQELTTVIGRAQSMLASIGKGTVEIKPSASAKTPRPKSVVKKRRRMSAAARAKIAAAQKARWAKVKKTGKS